MGRTRSEGTGTTGKPAAQTESAGAFTCPECGRAFGRPAALGAHRRRAHGVAGTARKARARSAHGGHGRTGKSARIRARSEGGRKQVDRDALLETLFPNGIPAREAVIRAANDWLDLAEQLAKMR
jgi:predicted RNA-binding Zn-ribbon protein involved in translation (DUF1610 family)